MKTYTLFRGVRAETPWESPEKQLKNYGSFSDFFPSRLYIPMVQHAGPPCEAMVKPGDRVLMGQKIGDSSAPLGVPVHASVSGTVVSVEERYLAEGRKGTVVIIDNDKKYEQDGGLAAADPDKMDREGILTVIREAGIVGMGGAAFPTQVKLNTGNTNIEALILNGCECEPLLSADDALMQNSAALILSGCRTAMKAVGAGRAIIGIEDNKEKAIHILRELLGNYPGIEVVSLPQHYPQGSEKQLIQSLTGREVPKGGLPMHVGMAVLNVATAAAIAEAFETGLPLIRRICTVAGDVRSPQNIRFPIGTLAEDLIAFCGGYTGTAKKIIIGGPMMGHAIKDTAVPLTKASGGLVVFNESHVYSAREFPCIRCSRCAEACPVGLEPLFIDRHWRKQQVDACRRLQAQSCINCGCCTYVCPAKRRLAAHVYAARSKINEIDRNKKNTEGR